jgi:histone-lysine N-methyltransferase SETMAR
MQYGKKSVYLVRYWGEIWYKLWERNVLIYLDQVILHQDNAPAHTSHTTQLKLDLLGFECLKHPPYRPDLAPMDFAVFPYIKSFFRGQRFDDLPELRQEVMNIILNMKMVQFEKIFDDWLKRCKKCVELNGDYSRKVNFYYCWRRWTSGFFFVLRVWVTIDF